MRWMAIVVLALGVTACASDSFDPELSPGLEPEVAAGKADVFGTSDIDYGDTLESSTGGNGLVIYRAELDARDQFRVVVDRQSGDLRPSAYLYEGTETFVAPDDYDVSAEQVSLNFTANASGEHFIVVRAYRGSGTGDFSISLTCTDGPCATGSTLVGAARGDECLSNISECLVAGSAAALDRDGSADLLESCLAAEAPDCESACAADPDLTNVCEVIVDELVEISGQAGCLAELNVCLDFCRDVNPFGYGEEEFMNAPTCWSGHQGSSSSATGSCLNYLDGVIDCGGTEYEGDTLAGCEALCENTDGAWDEGPFDLCLEDCDS